MSAPAKRRGTTKPPLLLRPRLVDIEAIAIYIGAKPRWVEDHVKLGDFPHVRVGRLLRFDPDQVDQWIEANSHWPAQANGAAS